jgi:hypothetical protein
MHGARSKDGGQPFGPKRYRVKRGVVRQRADYQVAGGEMRGAFCRVGGLDLQ